jgi:hypothetical protein
MRKLDTDKFNLKKLLKIRKNIRLKSQTGSQVRNIWKIVWDVNRALESIGGNIKITAKAYAITHEVTLSMV